MQTTSRKLLDLDDYEYYTGTKFEDAFSHLIHEKEFSYQSNTSPKQLLRTEMAKKRGNILDELSARDGNQCLHCGSIQNLTIDHIVPLSKGGTNEVNNLQILCKSCNSSKGAR